MAFQMYCDCGGSMHQVTAQRVTQPRRPRVYGDRKLRPAKLNRCCECKKLWATPRRNGRP